MLGITIDAQALEPWVRSIVAATIAAMQSERAEANAAPAEARRGRLLLTPRETAEAMGISERTLWGLTAPRGDLPAVPCGKRAVRYDPRDVMAWIEQHKAGKAAKQLSSAANGRRNGK
jgi:predicted DNA-binding transcriptional regulator AlpA